MFAKIFAITFLVFGSAKLSQAETTTDVILEFQPAINLLRTEITIALKTQGVQLGLAYSTIGSAVTQGETNIRVHLDALDAIVKSAQATAATNNADIQSCVDTVNTNVGTLDHYAVQKCRNVIDLENADQKLGLLGNLKGNVSRIISNCQQKNPSVVADLRTCIEGTITSIQDRSLELNQGITSDIDAAKTSTSTCVDSATSELGSAIEKISDEFQSCVAAA